MKRTRIAIIGGGCSGVLVALQLMKRPDKGPFEIFIIERAKTLGRGLAYNVPSDRCTLNVPADSMGAYPEDPAGFFSWLKNEGHTFSGADFVSRDLFGRYLSHLLDNVSKNASETSITHVCDEARDVVFDDQSATFCITLTKYDALIVDACVLALGNMQRGSLNGIPVASTFRSPYSSATYDDVGHLKEILIVGTGLTAVDSILEAEGRGFKGRYTMISRHGNLPLPHETLTQTQTASVHPNLSCPEHLLSLSLRALTRLIFQESRRLGSSQPCVTAIRPHTQSIWRGFSRSDKRCFLRHLRPLWEIHRHRIPASHWRRLQDLISAGRLTIHAGQIRSVIRSQDGVGVQVTPTLSRAPAHFDTAILCAGPEGDLSKIDIPLVKNLLARGIVVSGELGVGVDLNQSSLPQNARRVFKIIGPLQREALWEITAVRELRTEAARLAGELVLACSWTQQEPRRQSSSTAP